MMHKRNAPRLGSHLTRMIPNLLVLAWRALVSSFSEMLSCTKHHIAVRICLVIPKLQKWQSSWLSRIISQCVSILMPTACSSTKLLPFQPKSFQNFRSSGREADKSSDCELQTDRQSAHFTSPASLLCCSFCITSSH